MGKKRKNVPPPQKTVVTARNSRRGKPESGPQMNGAVNFSTARRSSGQGVRAGSLSGRQSEGLAPSGSASRGSFKGGKVDSRQSDGLQRKSSMYQRKGSVGMAQRDLAAKGAEDITRAPWYVGKIDRDDCDKAVMAANNGDFLVRLNTAGDKYVVCVNDRGTIQNFLVSLSGGTKVAFGGKTFDSMMLVLMHLRQNPINGKSGQLYYLGKPAAEMEWYVGKMNRSACEKMVLAAGKSDYCVRLASNGKQFLIVVNEGNGQVKNVPIMIGTGKEVGKFKVRGKLFDTVEDVLDDMRETPIPATDGTNLYLRKVATAADYYVGQMPRAECEAFVKKSRHGDYLIRQNTAGTQYVLVVNDQGQVMNYIIKKQPDGKFVMAGLPHDSLELLLRHLKKTPLASKTGGDIYLNRSASTKNAEDMMASVEFGFDDSGDDDDFYDDEPAPPTAPRSRGSMKNKGGGGSFGGGMPSMGDDDDDEDEDDEDEDDDEDDDEDEDEEGGFGGDDEDDAPAAPAPPPVKKFDPFRVVALESIQAGEIDCEEGEGLFVIGEDEDTWKAVHKGKQGNVPKDKVEKQQDRVAKAVEEEEEEEEEEDGFGEDFVEETEEEKAAREEQKAAERAEREAQMKEESAARMAAAEAEMKKAAEESQAEAARMAQEAAELEAKLAAMDNDDSDGGGFGSDGDD